MADDRPPTRGPEPTGGGDSAAGEVDEGLEVSRHPDLGDPEAHPEAGPGETEDRPSTTGAARSPHGAAEPGAAGGHPGVPVVPNPDDTEPADSTG